MTLHFRLLYVVLAPLVITLDDTLVASSCRPIQIDSCWLDKENKMRSPEIEPRPKNCTLYKDVFLF